MSLDPQAEPLPGTSADSPGGVAASAAALLRVLRCLLAGAASKAALSSALGQKSISGPLNQAVRQLLAAGQIEYTLPTKPNSRLQQYRLTPAGQAHLNQQDS